MRGMNKSVTVKSKAVIEQRKRSENFFLCLVSRIYTVYGFTVYCLPLVGLPLPVILFTDSLSIN
jgi:hypothetical protein